MSQWDSTPSTSTPAPVSPAGWFPVGNELHYWDGARWTGHRQPAPGPAPMLPAVPAGYGSVYYPGAAHAVMTDARPNSVEITFAWIITVLTLGYMLPWAVAATRGKSNSWAVALISFLLGWTFIGWVAALIMACTAHQVTAVRVH